MGVEIARRRWPDKRAFVVLIVIPATIPGHFMAQINTKADDRLIVLVLRRALRLQDVELGYAAVNVGYAAARIHGGPFVEPKPEGGHTEIVVGGVKRIGQQRVDGNLGGRNDRP